MDYWNNLPVKILDKTKCILHLSSNKELYPRKIKTKYGLRYVLNVGRRYRLISEDKRAWKLMTHESYNNYI
ncbi:hypothetical protein [Pseudoalteromonas denitrificans]|uniref:ParE family toxin-like protein n=1 Tax=Pseudoalteromonas denitrificans TaxID=43656 RepID=UPI003CCB7DE6